MTNLAAQYAPDVALPPYGEFDTPEPQAGLETPEHLYDSRGNPLNYIQNQGGPREFLVPNNQAVFAAPPGPNSPQTPVRLRGRGASPVPDYPLGPNTDGAPQDLIRRPQEPIGQVVQSSRQPLAPRAGLRVPSVHEDVGNASIQQRQTEDQVIGAAFDQRAMRNARNPANSIQNEFNAGTAGGLGTLQRLIEDLGYGDALRNFTDRLRGHAQEGLSRRSAPGAEMESELRGMSNPYSDLSMVDQPPDSAVPQVTPTSSVRWNGVVTQVGPDQQAGRAEEVAAMLRANGIRVTSVTRTRNARGRGHPMGNSIDVDPRQRAEAIRLINEWYPGLATEAFDIDAGENFGRGVRSTGNHAHIDLGPVAGPRRTQRTQR